jgi:glycosyltransferase involved in cell wall biosynthesis
MAIVLGQGLALRLVIAGKPDAGTCSYKVRLEHMARKIKVDTHILWAGQLSSLEMSWCYYNCAAFVMTSRAEACPNTALEAMSHGTLCISGDHPPMPEFFRDTALFYPYGDAKVLADVILRALRSLVEQQDGYRRATVRRSAEFVWTLSVQQTVQELEKACQ